jgi:ABC-type glycerol-3-phosphate transport system substrate-binding protein
MKAMKAIFRSPAYLSFLLVFSLMLSGCANLLPSVSSPTATSEVSVDEATPTATGATSTSENGAPVTLNLWLPARFDPNNGSLAATLFQDRLAAFGDQHPSVRVEVRLKAEGGESSTLNSLLAGQEAAPLALPDLVLAHSDITPSLADAGLLTINEIALESLGENDWYSFAHQMAAPNGEDMVLPFVADALILAYRETAIDPPPATWDALVASRAVLTFAAADPRAPFPMSQYLGLGEDREAALNTLYDFFAQAQAVGNFPVWLTQFTTQEQSWQAFTDGRAPMAVAWSNRFFTDSTQTFRGAPLPTQSGEGPVMVRGWSWAITSPYPEREALIAELVNFLNEPEFMSQWSAAAGYIPARPSALAAWTPDARQALASQVAPDAILGTSYLVVPLLGPTLTENVVALLKQEIVPADAVQNSLEALGSP